MFPVKDYNPRNQEPFVTVILIAISVAAFLIQLVSGEEIERRLVVALGVIPIRTWHVLSEGTNLVTGVGSLFTSMFVHASLLHLAGNMWFLWIFGDNVEDRLGRLRFLACYIFAGLGADAAHIATNINSQVPMIGASGAISGVMGLYLVLFPNVRIEVAWRWTSWHMSARSYLGIWIVFQLLMGFLFLGKSAGIAWWAHIGGFASGMVMGLIALPFATDSDGSSGRGKARA
jgi:membrane associated rhomboid family serine protease